ncbi:energy transducer TonB [Larkinella sp. C7]|uniref:energy transducer TonB n=1 Tax=Larkinella sp. C7 TaxID=2576607 RepID=UPI0011115396|nr:energy transducer TonB [Larkinella sp. C7]
MIRQSFLTTLSLLGMLWFLAQCQPKNLDSASTFDRPVYLVVDDSPTFSGGMSKFGEYIGKHLHYPETARKAGQEGKVFVTFIVSEQGRIEKAEILKGLGSELDAEAIRLIENMPAWIPAKQGGQVVACRYNLPINFSLNGSR